ncbi:MAG: type II secretion system F family protein [Firmicutes bacterium]|nr:type II secretion system F family protein [Bacillota bacterium]
MHYGISFCVFSAVVFLSIYILDIKTYGKSKLAILIGIEDETDIIRSSYQPGSKVRAFLKRLQSKLAPMLPGLAVKEFDSKLEWAGKPFGLGGEEFYIIKIGSALVMPVLIPVLILLGGGAGTAFLLVCLGLLGYFVPDLWLAGKVQERQKAIKKQLLNFIDILVICSDAGLNLSEAIKRTCEHQKGLLGVEFARAIKEIEMGKSRRQALEDLARRNGVDELEQLAHALNQAEQYGSPIVLMLKDQAKHMREMRRNKAQEAAQTSSVKILFPVVVFNFIPLMIILLSPAVVSLGRSF